jgi:hypothetical protein
MKVLYIFGTVINNTLLVIFEFFIYKQVVIGLFLKFHVYLLSSNITTIEHVIMSRDGIVLINILIKFIFVRKRKSMI